MSQTGREEGRKQRGQVSDEFINPFRSKSNEALIPLLTDENAQVRTAAATILGERKMETAIQPLCIALTTKSALYSRLAICEALVSIGDPAIDSLIHLLGRIGSNQHRTLPEKGFYKSSYPLPRDIAARTLIRMGLPVLEKIKPVLQSGERVQLLEAIDVVGHISNQYRSDQCLESLLSLYDACGEDDLMKWKILRAFQAFPNQQVTDRLLDVISASKVAPLRWEAVRSLGLQDREFERHLLVVLQRDGDRETRNLLKIFFS